MHPAHNERIKLMATALNNLGVASIVTGGFAPTAAYFTGSLVADDPIRLLSVSMLWLGVGLFLLRCAQHVLWGIR